MKVLEIDNCGDCPYCEFYDYYEGIGDDVCVCSNSDLKIDDTDTIASFCKLKDER